LAFLLERIQTETTIKCYQSSIQEYDNDELEALPIEDQAKAEWVTTEAKGDQSPVIGNISI
jgi:hypothetical protein